jgi:hypothetical protein
MLCLVAKVSMSAPLAMVPLGFVSSQRTAASSNPANRANSTEPSVWPCLSKTPPAAARSGNTCPGRVRSEATASFAMAVRIVVTRSAAYDRPAPAQVFNSLNEANLKWELHRLNNCGRVVENNRHMKRSSLDKARMMSGPAQLRISNAVSFRFRSAIDLFLVRDEASRLGYPPPSRSSIEQVLDASSRGA